MFDDERFVWVGRPQLSRFLMRAVFLSATMLLLASVGLYLAFYEISMCDFCGAEANRSCRKMYVWPWLGLAVAALCVPFIWLRYFLHASGVLGEHYGLTNQRALALRANPFDRFQSVSLEEGKTDAVMVRNWFGSFLVGAGSGNITFLCLSDAAGVALRNAVLNQPIQQAEQ